MGKKAKYFQALWLYSMTFGKEIILECFVGFPPSGLEFQ